MKKYIALLIGLLLCMCATSAVASANNYYIQVKVEGERVYFDQPPVIIDGRTLIPIRAVMEKIGAKIDWNNTTRTMTIVRGDVTLSLQIDNHFMQVSGKSPVQLDVPPQIYGGRTLLPIRAVAENLGFKVSWNPKEQTLSIEENAGIYVKDLRDTQVSRVNNWATVSSVHQFPYKNQGLAFAYEDNKKLIITTQNKTLAIDMKYFELGDVIADANGNFYITWGQTNDTLDADVETVFISKYSPEGEHIKTTGFVGKSSPWGDSDSAKTKMPFRFGNSVSTISKDGILVNYHGKQRYDGHQSDNVVAVRIADMSPYQLPNDTYAGHSFNQSVIYSEKLSDFLFASHGDAYPRGFKVNNSSGRYGNNDDLLFHFYLEPNANYNMGIVNKTFAQLGGIVETSKGIVLVGASAKSISEKAKDEVQNLFVQFYDPTSGTVSQDKFLGGEIRSGALSTNINDNQNVPLTNVTNYGVHWLTDYSDTDVIAPQVVVANDKVVILWSTIEDTFYMVLSNDGKIIKSATSMGGRWLNSFESPIYHDGAIHWAAANNGRLKLMSIKI